MALAKIKQRIAKESKLISHVDNKSKSSHRDMLHEHKKKAIFLTDFEMDSLNKFNLTHYKVLNFLRSPETYDPNKFDVLLSSAKRNKNQNRYQNLTTPKSPQMKEAKQASYFS